MSRARRTRAPRAQPPAIPSPRRRKAIYASATLPFSKGTSAVAPDAADYTPGPSWRQCREGGTLEAMKASALFAGAAVALFLAQGAAAGVRTTTPSKSATVFVLIKDTGITVYKFSEKLSAGSIGIDALRGPVPRGDILHFQIVNRGKQVHDFAIFGRKTPVLKPGQKARFNVPATTRGSFPYKSTLDRGKTFRGFFTIY